MASIRYTVATITTSDKDRFHRIQDALLVSKLRHEDIYMLGIDKIMADNAKQDRKTTKSVDKTE